VIPLEDLFPLEDYRFHLTIRKGDLREFFAPSDDRARVLAERRHWLQAEPEQYAALLPDGERLLAEWAAMVAAWSEGEAVRSVQQLGAQLEPDFLLLSQSPGGEFLLQGGAVVFPSSWSLPEKLGRTLDAIHDVVPGLNAALAPAISTFLTRLRPGGPAYLRSNWGLAATDALNLHPSRPRPALRPKLQPEQIWVRVEHQILVAMPETKGIVFGIRVVVHPLTEVLQSDRLRAGFNRAIKTMPPALAHYKGLSPVDRELVEWSRP
jgi:dimethylamine monooxygenase subunit A